jgi:hypothetical protein
MLLLLPLLPLLPLLLLLLPRRSQVAALVLWWGTLAGYYALFVPMLLQPAWRVAAIVLYSMGTAVVLWTYLLVRCG